MINMYMCVCVCVFYLDQHLFHTLGDIVTAYIIFVFLKVVTLKSIYAVYRIHMWHSKQLYQHDMFIIQFIFTSLFKRHDILLNIIGNIYL